MKKQEELMIQLHPIGIIKSPVTKMSPGNWGDVQSEIHLERKYVAGLKGLGGFSHLIVVFYMHRASFEAEQHLLRRPRADEQQPKTGVFAQRTKYRPNPIGISAVKLLSIKAHIIAVQGLDALDNSPLLDLKPYMPIFDKFEDVRLPDWVGRFEEGYF